MSKRKNRQLDRRRERRGFNAVMDHVKQVGHGFQTGWKRQWNAYMMKPKLKGADDE